MGSSKAYALSTSGASDKSRTGLPTHFPVKYLRLAGERSLLRLPGCERSSTCSFRSGLASSPPNQQRRVFTFASRKPKAHTAPAQPAQAAPSPTGFQSSRHTQGRAQRQRPVPTSCNAAAAYRLAKNTLSTAPEPPALIKTITSAPNSTKGLTPSTRTISPPARARPGE